MTYILTVKGFKLRYFLRIEVGSDILKTVLLPTYVDDNELR